MVGKCSWVSFWAYAKVKVAGAFRSGLASLRRSIHRQIPDGYTLEGVEKWMKEIRPEILKIAERQNKENLIKELNVQECGATMLNSNSLLETKDLLPSKENTNMFQKLREDFERILTKIGIVSHRLLTYLNIAITFGYTLLTKINTPGAITTIKEMLPANLDPALVDDFISAVVKAIGYLTQSAAILGAGSPDQMLQLFLADVQKDVPGVQKTKVFAFVGQIVGYLDGNSKLDSLYNYLVSKYVLKGKLDALEPVSQLK